MIQDPNWWRSDVARHQTRMFGTTAGSFTVTFAPDQSDTFAIQIGTANGAQRVELDADGSFILDTDRGRIRFWVSAGSVRPDVYMSDDVWIDGLSDIDLELPE